MFEGRLKLREVWGLRVGDSGFGVEAVGFAPTQEDPIFVVVFCMCFCLFCGRLLLHEPPPLPICSQYSIVYNWGTRQRIGGIPKWLRLGLGFEV